MTGTMDVQLIYVESAKLYVALHDHRILEIQKDGGAPVNPHAVRVECLDVTTAITNVRVRDPNDWQVQPTLYLDASDLLIFVTWLRGQMPDASVKAFGDRLTGYFAGSADIREMCKALGWIVAGQDAKRPPAGEERYFINRAREADPDGFLKLAIEYAARPRPAKGGQ